MRTTSNLTGIFLCFLTLVSNGQEGMSKGSKAWLRAEIDSILQSQVEHDKIPGAVIMMAYDSTLGFKIKEIDPAQWNGWRTYILKGEVNDGNAWYANGGISGAAGQRLTLAVLLRRSAVICFIFPFKTATRMIISSVYR